MPFTQLGLSDKVLAAVTAAGYTQPTPIQEQAIPHVLARRDVLGIAQTGTGKTAAFVLPMLTILEKGRARARMPRTLILEPTRELAAQVEDHFAKYGVNHKLNLALLIGGVSYDNQDMKLTRGVDVLIATPGRLLDQHERGQLLLSGIEILVIDEADRMLDMGFIPDIEKICKMVPFTRQTLFFSATMPPEIQRLVGAFLSNPVRVEVSRPASTVAATAQTLVSSAGDPEKKREVLRRLIRGAENLKNGIIFCNRKTEVSKLHRSLVRDGFSAIALHGDMDQRSRTNALEAFRNGEITLLVASDVAARGLDIPEVSHIFNFDVPHHAEDYVHRIGRTGRAGRTGTAITLVSSADSKSLAAIEKLIGQKIPWSGEQVQPEPNDGDHGRHGRDGRKGGSRREPRHRGPARQQAPARQEPARPQAQPRHQEPARQQEQPRGEQSRGHGGKPQPALPPADTEPSHLPAFLLRPVPLKAE
jgi:superfamily II DNA/RNA helicase